MALAVGQGAPGSARIGGHRPPLQVRAPSGAGPIASGFSGGSLRLPPGQGRASRRRSAGRWVGRGTLADGKPRFGRQGMAPGGPRCLSLPPNMWHLHSEHATSFVKRCHMFWEKMPHLSSEDATCSGKRCHIFFQKVPHVLTKDATCSEPKSHTLGAGKPYLGSREAILWRPRGHILSAGEPRSVPVGQTGREVQRSGFGTGALLQNTTGGAAEVLLERLSPIRMPRRLSDWERLRQEEEVPRGRGTIRW